MSRRFSGHNWPHSAAGWPRRTVAFKTLGPRHNPIFWPYLPFLPSPCPGKIPSPRAGGEKVPEGRMRGLAVSMQIALMRV